MIADRRKIGKYFTNVDPEQILSACHKTVWRFLFILYLSILVDLGNIMPDIP